MDHWINQRGNKYLGTNDNKTETIQNLWDAAKSVLRGIYYDKKNLPHEATKISNKQPNLTPKATKEKKKNPKVIKKKKIKKNKEEKKEIETKKKV